MQEHSIHSDTLVNEGTVGDMKTSSSAESRMTPDQCREYAELFQSIAPDLVSRLERNWSREDAEDIVQETAMELFTRPTMRIEKYEPERPFQNWAMFLVFRKSIDELRFRTLHWISTTLPGTTFDRVKNRTHHPQKGMIVGTSSLEPEHLESCTIVRSTVTIETDPRLRDTVRAIKSEIARALDPEMAENFGYLIDGWSYADVAELRKIDLNRFRTRINYFQRTLRTNGKLAGYLND